MTDPSSGLPGTGGASAGTSAPAGTAGGATSYRGDGGQDVSGVSVGQIMSNISSDLSTLMRQEVALAKAELKQEASKAGKAAGMLGGAGFAGYLTILFLSLALWAALGSEIGWGWSGLIVAVLWGVVAAVLFVVGRKRMKDVNPKPEQTVETMSEIPPALKPNS
jgi:hypothetical protein